MHGRSRLLAALAGVACALAVIVAAGAAAPGPARAFEPASALARVEADRTQLRTLARSFDLTEHGRDGWYDVVLYPGDRARLEAAGLAYRIVVPDLAASFARDRALEAAAQAAEPGRRLTYRRLADYEAELTALEEQRPDIVRGFTLPRRTHEGRAVRGVEIATGVRGPADGRPTAAIVGLHHAREWPSGEVTMTFAQDLVRSYAAGEPAVVSVLNAVRVLVVPVVNPDGFVRSRELAADEVVPVNMLTHVGELAYHRKNMRPGALTGEFHRGVDPNRNYPFRWGGPGSSGQQSSESYRGPAPGSEPEVENLAGLFRSRHVTALATNHTYSDLVLRPWAHTERPAPDEAQLKSVGDAMARLNGYASWRGIELYPTTGTTDEWLYAVAGGLAYTFEIGGGSLSGFTDPLGCEGFHPMYSPCVDDFYRLNRPAFLRLLQAARTESLHAVLRGTAPAGTKLTTRKEAVVPQSFGPPRVERLEAELVVPAAGTFRWLVNPSPLAETVQAQRDGLAVSLEPYRITATYPNGTAKTIELVVRRGDTHTLAF